MSGPTSIEGFAIISADSMIADAAGHMSDALKIAADQEFFYLAALIISVRGARGAARAARAAPRDWAGRGC